MNKPTNRFLLQTGGALALICSPMVLLAQTPTPNSVPPGLAAPAEQPPAAPSTADGSFLLGLSFGEQIHKTGIGAEVSVDDIARGIKEGLAGKHMGPADQQQLQTFVKSMLNAIINHNKDAAKKFLAQNAQAKGVKTTVSGLQYKVLIPGDLKASSPAPTDTVTVQYRGTLIDGTEFDSSYARSEPTTFPVNGVIKGWQEALVLMKPGSKWQVFVSPELGYDANPRPGIPGGSLLIFEVELVKVAGGAKPTPH
jgi:FKBP-type peptidyl-prolyl cis-trans isomerase